MPSEWVFSNDFNNNKHLYKCYKVPTTETNHCTVTSNIPCGSHNCSCFPFHISESESLFLPSRSHEVQPAASKPTL